MSMFDLSGRVAIVTGGNGGIGLGMAEGIAAAGAIVVLAGRNATKGAAAVKQIKAAGGKAEFANVDVTDEKSCRALIDGVAKQHGKLNILVNNAGINIRKPPDVLDRRRMALGDRHQPDQRVRLLARRLSAHEEGGRRQDHQHRLDDVDLRGGLCAGLCGEQGRHRAVRTRLRDRLGEGQHPGQRRAAGLDRHRPDQERTARGGRPARSRARRARRRDAGAIRRISPASRCFWRAPASDFVTGTAIPVDGGFSVQG